MEKLERHLINWLIIAFFGVVDLYLIPLAFIYLWPDQASYLGDIFAWSGAIIGGSLTLIGVRMTLKKQENDRFLSSYKKELQIIDEFLDKLIQFTIMYDKPLWRTKKIEQQEIINDLLSQLYECKTLLEREISHLKAYLDWEITSVISELIAHLYKLDIDKYRLFDDSSVDFDTKLIKIKLYFEHTFVLYTAIRHHRNSLIDKYKKIKAT
jgi:hypothetical protein